MSLYENWVKLAYDNPNQAAKKKLWNDYFPKETKIYKQLLSNVNESVVGKVSELAEKYDMDLLYFIGFLDGINESIEKPNPVKELKEDTKVNIKIKPEDLYYNMVDAKATWLYNLPEWDNILTKGTRETLYRKCKSKNIVYNTNKIYPNDPCPCGSGKKYKKCCGANS